MAEENTKQCEACDAIIAKDEEKCPKCGVEFAELEETVSAVSRAQSILAKRKAKETPSPTSAPATKLKGAARLRSFGKLVK